MTRVLAKAEAFLKKMTKPAPQRKGNSLTTGAILVEVQDEANTALKRAHVAATDKRYPLSLRQSYKKDMKLVMVVLEDLNALSDKGHIQVGRGLEELYKKYYGAWREANPGGSDTSERYASPVLKLVEPGMSIKSKRTEKTEAAIWGYFATEIGYRLNAKEEADILARAAAGL